MFALSANGAATEAHASVHYYSVPLVVLAPIESKNIKEMCTKCVCVECKRSGNGSTRKCALLYRNKICCLLFLVILNEVKNQAERKY